MKLTYNGLIVALAAVIGCGGTPEAGRFSDSALLGSNAPSQADTQLPATILGSPAPADDTLFHEEWIPGDVGTSSKAQAHFLARIRWLDGNRLLLRLDRAYPGSDSTATKSFVVRDSITISVPDRLDENFTPYCEGSGGSMDGKVGGLIKGIPTMGQMERPWIAWIFDTVAVRIRQIPTDSVTCMEPEDT